MATDRAIIGSGSHGATTSSTEILPDDVSRGEFLITNDSDTTVYLALGEDAVVGGGIRVNAAGGFFGSSAWRGSVEVIHGGTGTKNLTVVAF